MPSVLPSHTDSWDAMPSSACTQSLNSRAGESSQSAFDRPLSQGMHGLRACQGEYCLHKLEILAGQTLSFEGVH